MRQDADGGALGVCPSCGIPYAWSAAESADLAEPGAVAAPTEKSRRAKVVERGRGGSGTAAEKAMRDTLVSALVLALGCFMPLMSVPIVGSISATQLRFSDGYILLALAACAVWLAHTGKFKQVRWPGWAALVLVVVNFVVVLVRVQQMKGQVRADLQGNPFGGMAELLMQSVQLQWGWLPLVVGALGLVAVGHGKRLPLG